MFVCKMCNYKTMDISSMKKHIFAAHSSTFKCEYCPFETESNDKLEYHQYQDHGLHIAEVDTDDMRVVIINDDEHTVYSAA